MTEIPAPVARVRDAAETLGLDIGLRVMDVSARTAEEAAAACGCVVGAIVKSLVFRGVASGAPILLLVSGANRVNETKVAEAIGEAIERPDAAFVRGATGFAIGGIPPFAHATPLANAARRLRRQSEGVAGGDRRTGDCDGMMSEKRDNGLRSPEF